MTTTTQSSEKDEPVVLPVSLRDYFAAAAITGLLAQTHEAGSAHEFARQAYVVADAMLKERAK